MTIIWKNEIGNIKTMLETETLEKVGKFYGVSRQRMYQVLTKYGIGTNAKKRKNFLRDKGVEYYWLNKMLTKKKLPRAERLELLNNMELPEYCPILTNIKLNYDGTGNIGWTRGDDSPSIDRIDNAKGYTKDNIHIISWRANRLKNDGTAEEHLAIYKYISNLTK